MFFLHKQKTLQNSLVWFGEWSSLVSFSQIQLKMFLIGFTSGDQAGIANSLQPVASNAVLAFLQYWIGFPSCKIYLFLGLILSLNVFGKSLLIILAKLSPIILPKYWVHITKPSLYDIPTRKLADLPPVPFFSRLCDLILLYTVTLLYFCSDKPFLGDYICE